MCPEVLLFVGLTPDLFVLNLKFRVSMPLLVKQVILNQQTCLSYLILILLLLGLFICTMSEVVWFVPNLKRLSHSNILCDSQIHSTTTITYLSSQALTFTSFVNVSLWYFTSKTHDEPIKAPINYKSILYCVVLI